MSLRQRQEVQKLLRQKRVTIRSDENTVFIRPVFSVPAYHPSDDASGGNCKVSNSPRMSPDLTDLFPVFPLQLSYFHSQKRTVIRSLCFFTFRELFIAFARLAL